MRKFVELFQVVTRNTTLLSKIMEILKRHFNYTLGPLLLILIVPNFILTLWFIAVKCDGSFIQFYNEAISKGVDETFFTIWRSVNINNTTALCVIIGYSIWAICLHLLTPGPKVNGPITPKGNVPVYKDNGFYNFIITMIAFGVLTYTSKTYYNVSPTWVYDHFGDFLVILNVYSLLLCIMLYLKGRFAPSTSDSGSSGNIIFDYYWGTELYPNVFGVDVKVFTNCRFGMTVWPLLVTIFAIKNYELYGFVDSMWVSWTIQMTYFAKFFWWESGYYRTTDIMTDRAGFYICWGCLVFIAGFYASVSLFLVNHPVRLGITLSVLILVVGLVSICINYLSDKQKQDVRKTNGACLIWGRKPDVIKAKYVLENGKKCENLLLVSGWWGFSRHFHYVPELCLAFCWSVPALFTHVMPYLYVIFLTVLLIHRTFRDDEKCKKKYTVYWNQYTKKVPYRMIPYLL